MNQGLAFILRGCAVVSSVATIAAAAPTAGALLANPGMGWVAMSLVEGLLLSAWYWLGNVDHRKSTNQTPIVVTTLVALGLAIATTMAIHGAPGVMVNHGEAMVANHNPLADTLAKELAATSKLKNPEEYDRLLTLVEAQTRPKETVQQASGGILSWAVAAVFPVLSVLFMVLAAMVSSGGSGSGSGGSGSGSGSGSGGYGSGSGGNVTRAAPSTKPNKNGVSMVEEPKPMVEVVASYGVGGYLDDLNAGKITVSPNGIVSVNRFAEVYNLSKEEADVVLSDMVDAGALSVKGTGHLKRYYRK